MKTALLFKVLLLTTAFQVLGQSSMLPEEKQVESTMEGWAGLYTKYRIGKKFYYYGEYHYRRRNYLKDMGQIYLRYGATYFLNKKLELTAGFVTPFYWAPNPDAPNIDNVIPQYRIWEQAVFVVPFERVKVYHQIRVEQRWRRDYIENSPFELTWRFRYKISTYIPLNNPQLVNNTLFFSGYEEILIQAGKPIVYDHLEDNRLFFGLGYIINEKIQIQAGYMWSYRHAGAPYKYQNRHIARISIYHNLDFYSKKLQKRQPVDNKILQNEF